MNGLHDKYAVEQHEAVLNRRQKFSMLSRDEIQKILGDWYQSWNNHNLDEVMDIFHDDIVFVSWTGGKVRGKKALQREWISWFRNHGGFRFIEKETFIDEVQQKALFRWQLEWPSMEIGFEGMIEKRGGVDVLHFKNGKIIKKLTFSKTYLDINDKKVQLVSNLSTPPSQ